MVFIDDKAVQSTLELLRFKDRNMSTSTPQHFNTSTPQHFNTSKPING
jgi:hypothetical protein